MRKAKRRKYSTAQRGGLFGELRGERSRKHERYPQQTAGRWVDTDRQTTVHDRGTESGRKAQ